ncbi:MFS transporter, ACS family, solute carrier family 17 (sodium-dependent inorganic phosphate [Mytilus galloprovincialis]|uniref:MFS transporter, ACS family, solute carrier family 17 (sodium-dependent inorganic phosphate) n=2 Tax=Mytilus galloprovincialis TaxID=29158 RepID=A0A8B6EEG2_MYTGA|nr:MFS transporter, ACS family, solute carrier family 17 (sodium-dependent inorganic phosphate [Mytilus galloprovincialis]
MTTKGNTTQNGCVPYNGTFNHKQEQNGVQASEKHRVSFSNNTKSTPISADSLPEVSSLQRPSLIEMYTSKRWGITFLALTVITLSLTLRMGMSMAIVCMVKPKNNNESSSFNQSESLLASNHDEEWLVDWDSDTQGQVLSSYYYGFPFFCVLGGYAAGKYSGKIIMVIMMTTLAVASMGIPYAAITSPYIVMVLRIIVGLASGGIMPCIMQILSKWTPLFEKSQIIATAMAGQIMGNVVTFVFSGLMCSIPYQNGWPFIFYIFGALNLLIMLVWVKVVYDHPEDHPNMTKAEVDYITRGRRDSANVKMPDPPWLKIVTSPAFWAILSAHISFGYIFTTLGTFLPLYMNDIMKFDTTMNGVVSSVPFIGRLLGTMVSGYFADKFYVSGLISTRSIRILFQSIGMFLSAPFLIGLSFLDHTQRELAVVLLILYWFVQGASSSGFRANHLDIAPRYAGVLNGMTITFSSLASLVSPLLTTAIVKNGTQEEWQIVFIICAGVGIVGTVLFDCFAQGEEQSWAQDKEIKIKTPHSSRTASQASINEEEYKIQDEIMQMSLQENAKDTDKARCASLECDEKLKDETQLGIDNKIFTPEDNGTNNNILSQANGKESNLAIINNDPTMEDEIPLDTSGMVYKEDKFHEIEIPIQIDDKSGVENNNQNSFHHESSIQMSDSNEAQTLVNRKRLKLYIPNRKDESTRL